MVLPIEMVVDLGVNCAELLQRLHALKSLHRPFASSKRLMRILRAIVEPTADLLTIGVADLIHRRRISPKPVGDDAPRPTVFLHDPLERLHCRLALKWGLLHFSCWISPFWPLRHIWRMTKTAKLVLGPGVVVQSVAFRGGRWVVAAECSGERSCPGRGETSSSRHSWHARRLQDFPIQGVRTTVELRSGRWRCRNELCSRKTFPEAVAIAAPFARKTRRVEEIVRLFAHAAGGSVSERLLTKLGVPS